MFCLFFLWGSLRAEREVDDDPVKIRESFGIKNFSIYMQERYRCRSG